MTQPPVLGAPGGLWITPAAVTELIGALEAFASEIGGHNAAKVTDEVAAALPASDTARALTHFSTALSGALAHMSDRALDLAQVARFTWNDMAGADAALAADIAGIEEAG
ncbi:hypothetical protein HT102_01210 [Hoyosella sp. G463]|uniref:Uncharacterized protein n=1 Tax=Lolliginicoccus lacisalsi TaxID=2742202 RepID=A0A927J9K5_9ACTN|nr:hypothetical protein [Lolliginicoccus lacisalsi]MBD8505108.1 hypothetical protein [Lolliginicoccus lacisalsi]